MSEKRHSLGVWELLYNIYITDIFSLGKQIPHIERKRNICLKGNKAIKQDLCVNQTGNSDWHQLPDPFHGQNVG
jgi:hypothetical protein